MEKLNFDSGVQTFRVGGGVLRFNPSDPNLYARFLEAADKLTALERELTEQAPGGDAIALLQEADRRVKDLLRQVFGGDNDLDAVFAGVNLLAVGGNGERVLTNFLAALEPVLTRGARACAKAEAGRL